MASDNRQTDEREENGVEGVERLVTRQPTTRSSRRTNSLRQAACCPSIGASGAQEAESGVSRRCCYRTPASRRPSVPGRDRRNSHCNVQKQAPTRPTATSRSSWTVSSAPPNQRSQTSSAITKAAPATAPRTSATSSSHTTFPHPSTSSPIPTYTRTSSASIEPLSPPRSPGKPPCSPSSNPTTAKTISSNPPSSSPRCQSLPDSSRTSLSTNGSPATSKNSLSQSSGASTTKRGPSCVRARSENSTAHPNFLWQISKCTSHLNLLSYKPCQKPKLISGNFHHWDNTLMDNAEALKRQQPRSVNRCLTTNVNTPWIKIARASSITDAQLDQQRQLDIERAKGSLLLGVVPKFLAFQLDPLPAAGVVPSLPIAPLPHRTSENSQTTHSSNNSANSLNSRSAPKSAAPKDGVPKEDTFCPICAPTMSPISTPEPAPQLSPSAPPPTLSTTENSPASRKARSVTEITSTARDAVPRTTRRETARTKGPSVPPKNFSSSPLKPLPSPSTNERLTMPIPNQQLRHTFSRRERSKHFASLPKPTPTRPTPARTIYNAFNSPNPLPTTPHESAYDALHDIYTPLNADAIQSGLDDLFNSPSRPSKEDEER
ncbi:hypothetical protein P7C70_g8564, partial [Phenoliferia sp. Uapishka_3]